MLSRIVPLRRRLFTEQRSSPSYDPTSPDAVHPLKLIIMSATLRLVLVSYLALRLVLVSCLVI